MQRNSGIGALSWILGAVPVLGLSVAFFANSETAPDVSSCAGCHADEHAAWQDSHHDHAMRHAGPDTVLGDFDDAEITVHGVTSRFFRRDGKYYVTTDGPDGSLQEFQIGYTFGGVAVDLFHRFIGGLEVRFGKRTTFRLG